MRAAGTGPTTGTGAPAGSAITRSPRDRRGVAVLVASNLLGGVGVASGVAVGGLVAEQLGGTALAGLGQATSVLGAAVAAIPLAGLAARHGRRRALSTGYVVATAGAVLVISSVVLGQLVLLLVGLAMFGVSNAVNLQSRYAAADHAPAASRARTMSVVIWATTVGAVAGPNLSAPGDRLGLSLGLPHLAGPYLFSVVAFALGALVIALLLPGRAVAGAVPAAVGPGGPDEPDAIAPAPEETVGAMAALRWAGRHPAARFAVVLIAAAHAVMVMVMVMTPVHMQHHGMTLELVGVVISLHVLGMYAASPLFGGIADRWGSRLLARIGMATLVVAVSLGITAALTGGQTPITALALVVLGLGWSMCVIAGSALLTAVATPAVRVPLQGVTDAGMNYAGALAAAVAGPVLAGGGFEAVNTVAAVLLVPAVVCAVLDARHRATTGAAPDVRR